MTERLLCNLHNPSPFLMVVQLTYTYNELFLTFRRLHVTGTNGKLLRKQGQVVFQYCYTEMRKGYLWRL